MSLDIRSIGEELNRIRKSDGLEVKTTKGGVSFLRFANSTFHQHIYNDIALVSIRSRYGKKTGTASTTDIEKDALVESLRKSEEIASFTREDPYLPDLMESVSLEHQSFSDDIKELTPDRRAGILTKVFEKFHNYKFYGVFFTYEESSHLFHSTGFELYNAFNEAQLNLLAVDEKNQNSVWIQKSIRKSGDIDIDAIMDVIDRKLSFGTSERLPEGDYTVILEPVALFDLMFYMPFMAFSGTAHVDGYSPLKDKIGEKVFSGSLTLVDDPEDGTLFPMKYDGEGVRKQKMTFVENGVFKNIAYDRRTAIRAKTESTGHAAGAFGGIMLMNLKMMEGKKTIDELVEETDRGIYITRFHYINIVDMQKMVFTGMTRDGTYLIENGKLTKPLSNMRFNVSLFDVFSEENLTIGNGAWDLGQAEMYGSRVPMRYRIPPVKIKNFKFIQS